MLVPGNGTLSCYLLGQIFIYEYTVRFLQTYWCSIDIFQTFYINKGFFVCFLLKNRTSRFWEVFFIFLFDGKLQYLYLIHLHQSYLKFQLLSPQASDPQHHLESQWLQGYSYDHIGITKELLFFFQWDYIFFKVIYFITCLWFSTCKSFIITSFKFSISLFKMSCSSAPVAIQFRTKDLN